MQADKNKIDVYIAPLPKKEPTGYIFPSERAREIENTRNESQRRERYYVWRLLEYALRDRLGLGIEDAALERRDGKWRADATELSLSHSGGALAVALSYAPVGVDIEPIAEIDREGVARRFFTEGELVEYLKANGDCREEAFLRIWTAKEAIFKSRAQSAFAPSSVDTSNTEAHTEAVIIENKPYILSAFAEPLSEVTVYNLRSEDILK